MRLSVRPWSAVRSMIWRGSHPFRSALFLGVGIGVMAGILVLAALRLHPSAQAAPAPAPGVALTSNLPSNQPVGTSVTWHAESRGLGAPVYQFRVTPLGGPARVVRDFSADAAFTWTPLQQGRFTIQVSAKSGFGAVKSVKTAAKFVIASRIKNGNAVAGTTNNPLVALYSAPPCAAGTLVVEFRPAAGSAPWQTTATQPCQAKQSINVLVAGMRPHTRYILRDVVTSGKTQTTSDALPFTTGVPPSGLKIATFTVNKAPTSQADLALPVIYHSLQVNPSPTVANPIATDLNGNLLWYYDTLHNGLVLVRALPILPGGTFLLIGRDAHPAAGNDGNVLREIDLAGNTIQETNIEAVSAQLVRRGQERIYSFNHDAQRLPNGDTAILGTVERQIGDHVVRGDMVVVLDADFQVVWTWDAFDHLTLPTSFPPGLQTCTAAKPCHLPASQPYDWTHANGISWSPTDDDLTVSIRELNLMVKIAYEDGHGDGKIVWRLGKDRDFALKASTSSPWFTFQHNTKYVSPDTVALFDNGDIRCNFGAVKGCESRGQVYKLDEQHHTATLLLSVNLGAYWQALGGAAELPNGDFSFAGGFPHPSKEIEFRPDGTKVYELDTSTSVYRAYRISALSF